MTTSTFPVVSSLVCKFVAYGAKRTSISVFTTVDIDIPCFAYAYSLIVYERLTLHTLHAVSLTSSKVKLSLFRKMRGLEGEAGRLASQVTRAWKRLVIFYDGPPLGRRTQETAHHGWSPQICFFYNIVAPADADAI